MKLKYFGTSAAEGIPGLFCSCATCARARQAGGRNIRSRSQALVDGKLLIDFPPDTYWHVAHHGLDLASINSLLITHGHDDHLHVPDFEMRKPVFAHTGDIYTPLSTPLRVYASEATRRVIEDNDRYDLQKYDIIELKTVRPFSPFDVEGYTVTGLKADHAPPLDPLIYLIENQGNSLLYANDTGWFPDETWEYLSTLRPKLGFVSLDCTGVLLSYRQGHMCVETNLEVRERLLSIGCADEHTIFCHHHFSHNGGLIHDEHAPLAAKEGFLVSYDGMEVEF